MVVRFGCTEATLVISAKPSQRLDLEKHYLTTKKISLATAGFELGTQRTRKRVFPGEMNLVVPWAVLVGLIEPFAPGSTGAKGGRPSFLVETMLRIHFLQQ